jgi:hypothetical protein
MFLKIIEKAIERASRTSVIRWLVFFGAGGIDDNHRFAFIQCHTTATPK